MPKPFHAELVGVLGNITAHSRGIGFGFDFKIVVIPPWYSLSLYWETEGCETGVVAVAKLTARQLAIW